MENILSEKVVLEKNSLKTSIFWSFTCCLIVLAFLSIYFLKPVDITGDGLTYVQAMDVLQTSHSFTGFVPNRILTTFFGLEAVIVFAKLFGNLKIGWIVLNAFFYFLSSIFFYKLILSVFKSQKTAFLAGLFLAGNYSMISFGLHYLMDIGGWTFYIISLYFLWQAMETENEKNILFASMAVGIGGLFKEYAFLAFIPLGFYLLYTHRFTKKLLQKSILPILLSFLPILFVYIYVYLNFHYTYLDWFGQNTIQYVYHSRIIEYVKSLGSLLNFLGFLILGGLYVLWKDINIIDRKIKLFLIFIIISILPIFFWPAITQRILFITVPTAIFVSSFLLKKHQKYFYLFLFILILYLITNFFMDSFVLKAINLPF